MMPWLSWTSQPQPSPNPPSPPLTDEQRVLAALGQPITLGGLSDATGLSYAQLRPILDRLQQAHSVRPFFWGEPLAVRYYQRCS